MHRYVFMDIDDVLLPWDFPNLKTLKEKTGFHDYKKANKKHMTYISFDMLNLINKLFGEHIYWLTTWELHGQGANVLFSDALGLPRYKELPYIGEYYNQVGGIWLPNVTLPISKGWWKAEMINRFINELDTDDYKLVWVDNEIDDYLEKEDPLVVKASNIPQVKLVSPYPVLTKNQIHDISDWLEL